MINVFGISLLMLLALLCIPECLGKRNFVISIERFEHSDNTDIINVSVSFDQTAGKNHLNLNYSVVELNGKLLSKISMSIMRGTKYMPLVKDIAGDVCELFRRPILPPIFKPIYIEFVRATDMPNRCPIAKGVYYIKNFYLNEERFPPYLPKGKIKFQMVIDHLYRKVRRRVVDVQVYGKVDTEN